MKPKLRFKILARDGFQCRYCGATSLETKLHVDHVHPRSKGGTDDEDNLVTACLTCNLGKHAKTIPAVRGVGLFFLIERLKSALEAYDDHWRNRNLASSSASQSVRNIGITLYELSGVQGLDAALETVEDEYIDRLVGHLDVLWSGIGSWTS